MKYSIITVSLLLGLTSLSFGQSNNGEPPHRLSQRAAYSLFYENYQNKDYDMALQFGRWMLEAKPRSIENMRSFTLDRQYSRFIDIYSELAQRQTDPSLRTAYVDSALTIFDEAFATFTEEEIDYFSWNLDKGRFYQTHFNFVEGGIDKAYQQYQKVLDMDAKRLTESGNGYFVRILLDNYIARREREKALALIDAVEPYANEALKTQFDSARDRLFDSPADRIVLINSRLESNPNDEALLSELAKLYEDNNQRDKAVEVARKLYDINPNFENTRKLADIAKSNAEYDLALRFLKEALEKADGNDTRKKINLEIAETYQDTGNLRSARQYARQAISLDRSWGQPYLEMSRIYAAAVTQCTQGRRLEKEDRAVYWLVLDYADRARSADSSLASVVQRQYQAYEPVLPTTEDIFFADGWDRGVKIKIDGSLHQCYSWINEETTIR
jgi:tetratricopeptide (TPR) repeat protein